MQGRDVVWNPNGHFPAYRADSMDQRRGWGKEDPHSTDKSQGEAAWAPDRKGKGMLKAVQPAQGWRDRRKRESLRSQVPGPCQPVSKWLSQACVTPLSEATSLPASRPASLPTSLQRFPALCFNQQSHRRKFAEDTLPAVPPALAQEIVSRGSCDYNDVSACTDTPNTLFCEAAPPLAREGEGTNSAGPVSGK